MYYVRTREDLIIVITADNCDVFFPLSLKLGRVPTTLEDVLHRPSAKDTAPQGAQQLQAAPSWTRCRFGAPTSLDIGVDDAVIYLLHTSLTHLEKAGSTVRIMFFDFSSAFNTIQPRLLGDKLQLAGVDHHLTTWILDYLTHRPQFVRVQGFESDRLLCSTGAPQGTVLAPFLFTLYTADFSYNTTIHLVHPVISRSSLMTLLLVVVWVAQPGVGLLSLITDGDDRVYRGLIQDFAGLVPADLEQPPDQRWECRTSDTVKSYKYLGVHLNDSLDWSDNTVGNNALVKKGNSRLFLLRRLRSFGVQGPLLRTFYDSVVASAIFYGSTPMIVCWASSITDRDRRRMDRLVRRASSVLGCPLDSVEVVGNREGREAVS
ncbi:hypothetical protein L3Q82_015437 [Scortum barcoo]|uniref:Uncharacterized protein n=1 Tax=Scortum barcoo TaxID=214431 RepID=A0ACB8VNG2_9TELE|nr:hypothetical protein L3Q82_015437 [Scortum barcoo]